jgi:hypothetical protein
MAAFDHSEQRMDLCALSANRPKARMTPLQLGAQTASDAGAVAVSEASAADASAENDNDNAAAVLEVSHTMRVQLVGGQVSSVAVLLPHLTVDGQATLGRLVKDMLSACGRAFTQRSLLVLD